MLLTADGLGTAAIMQQTGKSKSVVWRWQERFMQAGVDGLLRDKTRPARIPPLAQPVIDRVVALTSADPPGEVTHWTAAVMAKAVGISGSSVQRIWRAHGLEPQRIRQFKLSNDKVFADKLRKIVGLYVDPPAHAVVLSVDEKSQIQALDRTQPGLPIKKGRRGTMTHDYIRNGTTTLFAALNVLEGKSLPPRRRGSSAAACNVTGIKSSSASSMPSKPRSPPARSSMSSSTTTPPTSIRRSRPGSPAIRAFVFHFTPTSCSWLNAVEGFFVKLTRRRLKRGVFRSVVELQTAINRFIAEANHEPKPSVWTADPDKIIAAVNRRHQVLDSIH